MKFVVDRPITRPSRSSAKQTLQMGGWLLVVVVFLVSCPLLTSAKEDRFEGQSKGGVAEMMRHVLESFGVHMPRKNVPVDEDVLQYMLKLYNTHQDYLEGRSMYSPLLYDDETVWGIPTVLAQGSLTVDDRQNGRLRFAADLSGLVGAASSELTRAHLHLPSNSVEDCLLRVAFYDNIGHHSTKWTRIGAGAVLQSERRGERIEVDVRNLVGGWLRNKPSHGHNAIVIDVDPVGCDDIRTNNATERPFLVVYASQHRYPLPRPGSHSRSERAVRSPSGKKNNNNNKGRTGGCLLLPMKVDFVAWGWNDWIIAPKEYNAGVCNGSCVAYRYHRFTQHARAIANAQLSLTRNLGAPSCAPSKLLGRTMLLKLADGNLKVKNLLGMEATECQCM